MSNSEYKKSLKATVFSTLSGYAAVIPCIKSNLIISVIYVRSVEPEDVKVGDPITFVLNEDLVVATHRVIEIDSEAGCFYTKGDANNAADGSPVLFENLIGVPVFTIPYLGYFSDWVSNPPGMYIAISLAIVLVALMFLPDMLKKADEADKRAAEKKVKEGEGVDKE